MIKLTFLSDLNSDLNTTKSDIIVGQRDIIDKVQTVVVALIDQTDSNTQVLDPVTELEKIADDFGLSVKIDGNLI